MKAKEDEKITKYAPLEAKIQESHHVQTESVPIVVGALGAIPARLLEFLKAIGLPDVIGCLQTSALLGREIPPALEGQLQIPAKEEDAFPPLLLF